MATFYAWSIPANLVGKFADHTWVTTYDCRRQAYGSLEDVTGHHERLWMCWGSFHPHGGGPGHPDGLLHSGTGRAALGQSLVESNADSVHVKAARGTVQVYGFEGVCHQVANQALFATGGAHRAPFSVEGSRGYHKSVHVYGQYGLDHAGWRSRVRACSARPGRKGEDAMPESRDDLVDRARQVLSDRGVELARLLTMREAYQAESLALLPAPRLSAEEIDARHDEHLREVAKFIGRDRFVAIYDQDPDDQYRLVDQEILAASRASQPDAG